MQHNETTFENWLEQVNTLFENSYGLSLDDLPDVCSRDAFEDGMSPQEAFEHFVENFENEGDLFA